MIWEFWNSFALWETEEIVKALNRTGISLNADKTLANVPVPVVYHLVSTPVAFRDRVILNLLETKPPLSRIDGWPDLPPPPGFLLLLMHQNGDVRKWVRAHVSQIKVFPKEQFTRPYMMVLRMIVEALSSGSSSSQMKEGSIMSVFPIPSDSEALWHNFIHVIPLVPHEVLQSKDNEVRMSRFIIGHLNDNAPRELLLACHIECSFTQVCSRFPHSPSILRLPYQENRQRDLDGRKCSVSSSCLRFCQRQSAVPNPHYDHGQRP